MVGCGGFADRPEVFILLFCHGRVYRAHPVVDPCVHPVRVRFSDGPGCLCGRFVGSEQKIAGGRAVQDEKDRIQNVECWRSIMNGNVNVRADGPFTESKSPAILTRHQTLFTFFLFIILALYVLGANPFAAQTVAPMDVLMSFPGYTGQRDHKTIPVVHWEPTDIIDSQLPTWITLKNQIRNGESPLWNPYTSGGQPVSLEYCNPVFLLFLLVKNNALAYYLAGLAKLVIAGFGAYLLLRIFLRWLPSLWGGIVFMLCGFNAAWFFWEQVATAMWLPWVFWATVMYLKTEDTKWLPAITLTSLLLISGGFPAVAAYGFYSFALLIVIWNGYGLSGDNWRRAMSDRNYLKLLAKKTVLPFLAVFIAFLMAAFALIPFTDSLSGVNLSHRVGGTPFRFRDILLFFSLEDPLKVERTAYIGIPAFLFALAVVFSAFRADDTRFRRFIFIHVALVVITILIVFDLLPYLLMVSIPVFKSNSWGRLIVVSHLGLAVLSAVGFNYILTNTPGLIERYLRITTVRASWIVALILLGILVLQFHSQKKLFNSFNAVIPSAWFYPSTPSIRYVKDHLKPLQSVIADESFIGAGALGAYGIAEWYAHSFRTDKEKEILSSLVHDPFPSATSSYLYGKNIQYSSPLMDKLAIKYLLVRRNMVGPQIRFKIPEISHEPAPPLPDNTWKQHLFLTQNDMEITALGFLFSTYGADHAPANVRLTLSRDNHEITSVELDKNRIRDNEWAFFEFPGRDFSGKGMYSLAVSLPGYAGPDKVTAWATKSRQETGTYLDINGSSTDHSLKMDVHAYVIKRDMTFYDKNFEKKWNTINLDSDLMIFENKQVTNSAYFIRDLDAAKDELDFSGLDVKQPSPGVITVNYAKENAGWIVLPMHLHGGWKAYINDRGVHYDTYLGMLPAIPVQGPSRVIFKYEPESFRWGVIVSLAGLLIFLIFSWRCVSTVKRGGVA